MKNSIVNRDQIIRDIEWILDNKPWDLKDSASYKKYNLYDFKINKSLLPEFYEFNRLGKYYEFLIGSILNMNGVEVAESNLQVINHGQTVGEFDFLIKENASRSQLEVAIKYYLEFDGEWIGPNSIDMWSIKKKRMESHQLQLRGGFEIESRYYWVQGIFFFQDVNSIGKRNVWLYSSQFSKVNKAYELFYIDKSQWLSGMIRTKVEDVENEILLIEKQKKARQYVLLFKAKNIESRIMVVPNIWPRN